MADEIVCDAQARRIDLDWIRIGAFLLLILYHVGMYYVTWDWHVKSPEKSRALEPLMLFTSPWRLALLFLVSGAATAFVANRLAAGTLARTRSWRLLPPLLLGIFVVVVPQAYFEVLEKAQPPYAQGYLEFWGRYLQADRTFCRGKDCLVVPTWNHLWFVAYLWVYTLAIIVLIRWAPGLRDRLAAGAARALGGWGVLVWPILVLAAWRMLLVGRFPSTHALVDDWFNHAVYFSVFALGFVIAGAQGVWAAMERARWVALGLGLASYAFIAWYFVFRADMNDTPEALRLLQRVLYAINTWSAIVAICGFGRRLLPSRDGPARRYLTEAIFPFYIVHQTAIIAFAVWLRPLALPPVAEGLLLVVLTGLACVLTYEAVRRVKWLRPLFGLKGAASPAPRTASSSPSPS